MVKSSYEESCFSRGGPFVRGCLWCGNDVRRRLLPSGPAGRAGRAQSAEQDDGVCRALHAQGEVRVPEVHGDTSAEYYPLLIDMLAVD